MVHVATNEFKSVAAAFIIAPIVAAELIGAVGASIITADELLALTGSQDITINTGIGAGFLYGVTVLYATYHIVVKHLF